MFPLKDFKINQSQRISDNRFWDLLIGIQNLWHACIVGSVGSESSNYEIKVQIIVLIGL